jgi:hypothetical protein
MRKKIMMLPVALFFLIVISANNIYAADCAFATIKRVGSNPTSSIAAGASPYVVTLDCSDDTKWSGNVAFYLSADLGDSGLATLLTAYSLGKTIWVRTLGITPGSIVTIVYMND